MTQNHPFTELIPDAVLDAVDAMGYQTNGRLLALNSYENRVYQVGLEDAQPVIAKFYRPERWTIAQIMEEHEFTLELAAREIPVVAPIVDENQQTLFENGRYKIYMLTRLPPVIKVLIGPGSRRFNGIIASGRITVIKNRCIELVGPC